MWKLTLENNPALREAQADVDAARGQTVQAGLYPNPRFIYQQDTIGSRIAVGGNQSLAIAQELVTAGKRRLDQAIAERRTESVSFAQLGNRIDVLTRIRRAYFNYLGLSYTARLNDEAVAILEKGEANTRRLVDAGKPATDLLRLQALLEETRINQAQGRINVHWAWKQLAAEVGVSELPFAPSAHDLDAAVPILDGNLVMHHVLANHTAMKERLVDVEQARQTVKRARAEAVPNVTVSAGYNNDAINQTAGWAFGVEVPLPIWDRKQGKIQAAQASLNHAQAAEQSTANRLMRETADTLARYQSIRQQVDRLEGQVLPLLKKSLDLLDKSYQGGGQVSFSDVLMTEQSYISARLNLAAARRNLWLAIADVQGLMQMGLE